LLVNGIPYCSKCDGEREKALDAKIKKRLEDFFKPKPSASQQGNLKRSQDACG
jgi:hypothetical protein